MKAILFAVALAAPLAALAGPTPNAGEPGFHERLYGRYCEKLRESPQAYVQFVNRMRLVYGYGVNDFATYEDKAPIRLACRESAEKLAAAMQWDAKVDSSHAKGG
jgi:hypothetical protein